MFTIFRKLQWFFSKNKKNYIIGITALIATNVFVLLPPQIMTKIMDGISSGTMNKKMLFQEIGLFFLSVIILYILSYIWSYFIFKGSEEIGKMSRKMLMKKYLAQSPIFFEKYPTGSLMAKATNDVNALREFAGLGILTTFDSTIFPIMIIGTMATTISWKLTLFSLIPLPIIAIATLLIDRRIYVLFKERQEAFDQMNASVLEDVSSVRIIRSFQRENSEIERFSVLAEDLFKKNMKPEVLFSFYPPISRTILGIAVIIAVFLGEKMIAASEITVGQLISFNVYLGMLVWPMFAIGEFLNVSEQASASMDRINEVLKYQEEVQLQKGARPYVKGQDIEFRDFSFAYEKKQVLNHVNLHIKSGTTLGIVGPIGSGKTSLVKQLIHLYPVENQTLFIGETPIEELDYFSLREETGYVSQEHILFSKSVEENVDFGLKGREDINRAMEISDFTKDLAYLAEGKKTLVGEKGAQLSGGQKQRIAIARAMGANPDILILDDSLSALDTITEKTIIENIKEQRKGLTTIIVAHRLSAVEHADHIIVLENGSIIEEGSHEELLAQEGWYARQYEYQQIEGGQDEA